MPKQINPLLPAGIKILAVDLIPSKSGYQKGQSYTYIVENKEELFDEDLLEAFNQNPKVLYTKKNRKGKTRQIDLSQAVESMKLIAAEKLRIRVRSNNGPTVRPGMLLQKIFHYPEDKIKQSRIIKLF